MLTGEPRVMVTGTGRSGTRYLREVLGACGLRAGHEAYWGPGPSRKGLDVDVSWCGAFDEGYKGPVYFQARHPLKVVNSIVQAPPGVPYIAWRRKHYEHTGDPVTDALRVHNAWTKQSYKRCCHWWRLEDIRPSDVWAVVYRATGLDLAEAELARAIALPGKAQNQHTDKPAPGWDSIPDSEDKTEAMEWADRLGYDA